MINERVSMIKVNGVDPHIARMFARAPEPGKITPQPGIIVHRLGGDRYAAQRMLESGGKITMVLEIVDGVLKPAMN
jgi:hypothetical protein